MNKNTSSAFSDHSSKDDNKKVYNTIDINFSELSKTKLPTSPSLILKNTSIFKAQNQHTKSKIEINLVMHNQDLLDLGTDVDKRVKYNSTVQSQVKLNTHDSAQRSTERHLKESLSNRKNPRLLVSQAGSSQKSPGKFSITSSKKKSGKQVKNKSLRTRRAS